MEMDKREFVIEKMDRILKFSNNSINHRVLVYLQPIPPKKKWVKIFILQPEQFIIFDTFQDNLELERIAYSFEEVLHSENEFCLDAVL